MSSVYYIFRNNMSCHTDIHTHTQKEDAHVSRKCVDSARYCLGADCFCGFWLPFSGLLVIWNLAISSAREHLCTEAEAVAIGRPSFGISLLPREREPREQAEIWNCWNSILGPCKSDKLLSNRKGLDEESRSPGSPSFHHIPTARGEHQAGRLPLAMSSPREFTGTAVTASGLVSIVSFVVSFWSRYCATSTSFGQSLWCEPLKPGDLQLINFTVWGKEPRIWRPVKERDSNYSHWMSIKSTLLAIVEELKSTLVSKGTKSQKSFASVCGRKL